MKVICASVGIDGEYAVIGIRSLHNGATADTGAFSVVKVREQNVQFLHTDHLGSPVAATGSAGVVVGTQSFYPFGEVRTGTGIFDTERGFTGQIRDTSTGLNFYNARYQDPVLGRFISPDSIVPDETIPTDWNRFAYVRGNPLLYVDDSGNWPGIQRFIDDVKRVFKETRQFGSNPENPPEVGSLTSRGDQPVVLTEMSFGLHAGLFLGFSIGVISDDEGNQGFTITPAIGGSTNVGVSADIRQIFFNADTIHDVNGWAALVEGGGGQFGLGFGCSGQLSTFSSGGGCGPELTFTLMPIEVNGGVTYTWVISPSEAGQDIDIEQSNNPGTNDADTQPRNEYWESAS